MILYNVRRKKILFIIGIGIFIILNSPISILNAETATQVENNIYSVTLIETKTPSCCPNDKELIFEVINKKTKEKKGLLLEGRVAAVKELILTVENKLTLIGELPRGGNIILVADLEKGEQLDTFRAYSFSFSPSKRYIIYETHYPPRILPDSRRSILLIYDFSKSARDNRLNSVISIDAYNAGIPVFPEMNLTQKSYNIMLDDVHGLISPFLWSDDENKIVFLEFYSQKNYLILLDLSFGLNNVKIGRGFINIEDFINRAIMLDATKKEYENRPIYLSSEKIQWKGSDKIVVIPYPQYWLANKIELTLPVVK